MMAMLPEITDAEFAQTVAGPEPVLVDFWAEWCGPCKRLYAVLEGVAAEFAGQVRFVRLDAAAHPESPARLGVLSLPTLILFRRGEPLGRWGMLSQEQLRQQLRKLL